MRAALRPCRGRARASVRGWFPALLFCLVAPRMRGTGENQPGIRTCVEGARGLRPMGIRCAPHARWLTSDACCMTTQFGGDPSCPHRAIHRKPHGAGDAASAGAPLPPPSVRMCSSYTQKTSYGGWRRSGSRGVGSSVTGVTRRPPAHAVP